MAIVTKEVELSCNSTTINRYEPLGYYIPREVDSQGRLVVKVGTKIIVKPQDLAPHSNVIITAKCDICGDVSNIIYYQYVENVNHNSGKYICSKKIKHNHICSEEDYNNLVLSIKLFYKEYGRTPRCDEFSANNGFISYKNSCAIAKKTGVTIREICRSIDAFDETPSFTNGYDEYSNLYINAIMESGCAEGLYSVYKLHKHKGMPDPRWMIANAPSQYNITDIDSWFEHYKIAGPNISKELATKLIVEYISKSGKPLMYDDFRGNKFDLPSISTVKKYWGTINKMKNALGLEIIQESMVDKDITIYKIDSEVKRIADDIIYTQSRSNVTLDDFILRGFPYAECTLRKYVARHYGCSMSEYLRRFGLNLVLPGRGLVYDFDDGERTTSQYEKMFSSYLRDLGLVYGANYHRNVKYSEIIDGYTGNMNCDYVIDYGNRRVYVEVAGVIAEYKSWYYGNKEITSSKTKNQYMKKLHEKESMLSNCGLEYYILFPCDLTAENLVEMLVFDYSSTFDRIKNFIHNNIDWIAATKQGKLSYDFSKLSVGGIPLQVISA